MRWSVLAVSLLCAASLPAVQTTSLSESVKARVQGSFPSPIVTLECDEGNAPTFQCRGVMADGTLAQVEASRAADGTITFTDLVYHVLAARSIWRHLTPVVEPAIATINCPGERITLGEIDCTGTLADGSAFTVHGNRRRDFALEVGPITYDARGAAPLVKAARAYAETFAPPVASITCPAEALQPSILCTANTVSGGIAEVRVTRSANGQIVAGSKSGDEPMFRYLRVVALAAAILGPLLAIWSIVRLVRLTKTNFVARVPLTPDATITFARPGQYVMMAEGPRFTMAWRGLNFSLRNAATGADVPLQRDLLNLRISGVSAVRHSYRRFMIMTPGAHVLHLVEAPAGRDLSQLTAYFGRSFLGEGVLCTAVGVAGLGMFAIGLFLTLV